MNIKDLFKKKGRPNYRRVCLGPATFLNKRKMLTWEMQVFSDRLKWHGFDSPYWWEGVAPREKFRTKRFEGRIFYLNPCSGNVFELFEQK